MHRGSDALFGAIRGIIDSIISPSDILELINNSEIIKNCCKSIKNIRSEIENKNRSVKFFLNKNHFVWEENSYWPLAYSSFLIQLTKVIDFFIIYAACNTAPVQQQLIEKGFDPSVSKFVTDLPPHYPTEFHYAAASLGAWLGGASNMHYFISFACKQQIFDETKNLEYGRIMGYTDMQSLELSNSGIICVPAFVALPLLGAQGEVNCFGGIAVNEFGLPNEPENRDDFMTAHQDFMHEGFFVDKYYRNTFLARKIKAEALFGTQNHLRDHYTDFYNSIPCSELLRCKYNCIPVIDVYSLEEMQNIIERIPTRGDGHIYYRGQNQIYKIHREEAIKKMLFGTSCCDEPSFLTFASRNNYNYDELHFLLRYFIIQELLNKSNISVEIKSRLESMCIDPSCYLDYAIMALAQHYGLPTNGLDVTTDIEVATWFAINKFCKNSDKIDEYTLINRIGCEDKKENYPYVFVCQSVLNTTSLSLQDCKILGELGLHAVRPERQKAKFFLGAHTVHQNRLAETVVCAFRLNPANYILNVNFDYLFPPPKDDPGYCEMLLFNEVMLPRFDKTTRINIFHSFFHRNEDEDNGQIRYTYLERRKRETNLTRDFISNVGRNVLCPCGSGYKYKQCHGK
ncbi:MAG: FRG domain-containing protein [Treponema sp.]|jgi:hypothetical protein|nr:FRG domain-containing protein [Treponema sp.]